MQAFELLESPLERARIGDDRAIGERGQRLDAQIDSNSRPRIRGHFPLLLHLDRDVPMPSLLRDSSREHLYPHCATGPHYPPRRQIPALFETQPTEPGQLDSIWEDDDGTSQAEASQPLLLCLGLGEA